MPDREKVIGLLQETAEYFRECRSNASFASKAENHFWELQNAANEAVELIKAQEPRVMKLEDVKAFGWDYCYLEEERLPGKVYRSVCGDYALTCITWPCIASMRIQHGDDSYGKKWRCWSAKPTDEQRQAVKWE